MSSNISQPWIFDTIESILLQSISCKYKHSPKIVQVVKTNDSIGTLFISDKSHLATVMLTKECLQSFLSKSTEKTLSSLKYSIIKLEKWHVSTVFQSGGTRDIEQIIQFGSTLPFAIQCSKITLLGGDDLCIVGDPQDINQDRRIHRRLQNMRYITMVKHLVNSQFRDSTSLPNGNGYHCEAVACSESSPLLLSHTVIPEQQLNILNKMNEKITQKEIITELTRSTPIGGLHHAFAVWPVPTISISSSATKTTTTTATSYACSSSTTSSTIAAVNKNESTPDHHMAANQRSEHNSLLASTAAAMEGTGVLISRSGLCDSGNSRGALTHLRSHYLSHVEGFYEQLEGDTWTGTPSPPRTHSLAAIHMGVCTVAGTDHTPTQSHNMVLSPSPSPSHSSLRADTTDATAITSTRLVIEAVEEEEEDTFPQNDFGYSQLDLSSQPWDREHERGENVGDSSNVKEIASSYGSQKSSGEVPGTSGEAAAAAVDNAVTEGASEVHTVGSTSRSILDVRSLPNASYGETTSVIGESPTFAHEGIPTRHEEGRADIAQVTKKRKLLRPSNCARRDKQRSEEVVPPFSDSPPLDESYSKSRSTIYQQTPPTSCSRSHPMATSPFGEVYPQSSGPRSQPEALTQDVLGSVNMWFADLSQTSPIPAPATTPRLDTVAPELREEAPIISDINLPTGSLSGVGSMEVGSGTVVTEVLTSLGLGDVTKGSPGDMEEPLADMTERTTSHGFGEVLAVRSSGDISNHADKGTLSRGPDPFPDPAALGRLDAGPVNIWGGSGAPSLVHAGPGAAVGQHDSGSAVQGTYLSVRPTQVKRGEEDICRRKVEMEVDEEAEDEEPVDEEMNLQTVSDCPLVTHRNRMIYLTSSMDIWLANRALDGRDDDGTVRTVQRSSKDFLYFKG